MIYIFYIVSLLGVWFFVFKRSTFDFVSAGYFGCIVYFMPGFHGLLFNPYYPDDFPIEPISTATYLVWIGALGGAVLTGILYNPLPALSVQQKQTTRPFTTPAANAVIVALLLISFVVALLVGGEDLFSPDKNDVLNVQDRSIILFATLSQVTLVLFIVQKQYIMAMPSILCVAFLVFIGFRSELAIAAFCIFVWIAYRDGVRSFFKVRNIFTLVSIVMFLFAYKFVYANVKLGRWDLVFQTLGDRDFLANIFLKSEPFITQSILKEVIERDFSIPIESFLSSLISVIPLSNVLTTISIDQVKFDFQDQLFPNLRYGVASNIYANFYAAMGYIGILIYIVIQNAALVSISRYMRKTDSFAKLALALVGSFIAFYIHRNDVANSITLINRILYSCLALWIVTRTVAALEPSDEPQP
ncbi:hypothetical protein [Sphingomonas sp.]|uniref:hypothetical protein n=1 Tax=Sphingomonas sp. TaxID=28214 RepID=UPI003AFFD4A1